MNWAYTAHKLRAMALLVFGRNGAAEDVFSAMLARWPDDAYALASRALVRAQLGSTSPSCSRRPSAMTKPSRRSGARWPSTPSSTRPGTASA
jgi:hypothetical protein